MFRSISRILVTSRAWQNVTIAQRNLVTTKIKNANDMPRVMSMINGQKHPGLFSKQEYENRLSKLRNYMDDKQLDACVFTSYQNINYYSGFLYCHFGRFYALIITPEDQVTVSAAVDGGQPWRRSHGKSVTYTDWQRDNFFHAVSEILKDKRGNVGIEFDHVTVENQQKFVHALSGWQQVDVGNDVMKMRVIKSAEEIEVTRHGARIADLGAAAAIEALEENVPEYIVANHSTRAMIQEIANTFPNVDIMDTWTWFQSGINTDGAHNPVSSRRVQNGDIITLNCFPMIQGYYSALERTLFLNHASDEHLRLWKINCDVHKHGLDLIKPGARCCDIAKELNEICEKHDLMQYRLFGYGHSFGTLCHYYGREAALELREDIETVLEPGMVLSMEPMIMIPEGKPGAGGYREHDILVVTETGAENITKFPYGPEHNIIKK